MKRKRGGHKKGKKKKGRLALAKDEAIVNLIEDERNNDYSDDNDDDEDDDEDDDLNTESRMEAETPPSSSDKLVNLENVNDNDKISSMGKPVGRVKVKLRTAPKPLESQSGTDKTSTQLGLDKQSVSTSGKMVEDSGNSLGPEAKSGEAGNAVRKPGSIKIKSSKALSSAAAAGGGGNSAGHLRVEKSGAFGIAQEPKLEAKDGKKPPLQGSWYIKQELDSALTVLFSS